MRCALSFDEDKDLIDQNIAAWGEMQSLSEEPVYREEDIKSDKKKSFLMGYKMAVDDVCKDLKLLIDDGEIPEEASDKLQSLISGDIAMQLFSILGGEEE